VWPKPDLIPTNSLKSPPAYVAAAWINGDEDSLKTGGSSFSVKSSTKGAEAAAGSTPLLQQLQHLENTNREQPDLATSTSLTASQASKMLWLASCMLDTLVHYRTQEGEQLSARIGIGCGHVVVGALGSLQPRLHLMGPAMRDAGYLEQHGKSGMLHVDEAVLRLCSSCNDSSSSNWHRATSEFHGWKVEEVRAGGCEFESVLLRPCHRASPL